MEFLLNETDFLINRLLPQCLTAILCGFIVGYGREIRHKPAGIRTIILICIGCTIYSSVGFYLAEKNPTLDPTRIIGQIATGIGFLGAGAIIKSDKKVTGVTTAAFIWAMSGISILIGSNLLITSVVLTILIVTCTWFFEIIEKKIHMGHGDGGE
jgi:putative Mg2+ transporter-C (MgtC) family protein